MAAGSIRGPTTASGSPMGSSMAITASHGRPAADFEGVLANGTSPLWAAMESSSGPPLRIQPLIISNGSEDG